MNNYLNTDKRLFLIKFAWSSTNGKFITDTKGLGEVIEKHYKGIGFEYIKEFDPIKNKFVKINKNNLNRFTSFETETNLILKKHNLI